MNQQNLSKWLKGIAVGVALCGLIFYFVIIPFIGRELTASHSEFSHWFWPWLIFFWITAIPCYCILAWCWAIASEIKNDRSFTRANALRLKKIMIAAIADCILFFVGNVVFLLLGMNHPSVFLACVFVCFVGICVAIVSGSLSYLAEKAAGLREENESYI